MSKKKPMHIRNSTAEFLIFIRQAGEDGIEMSVREKTGLGTRWDTGIIRKCEDAVGKFRAAG